MFGLQVLKPRELALKSLVKQPRRPVMPDMPVIPVIKSDDR